MTRIGGIRHLRRIAFASLLMSCSATPNGVSEAELIRAQVAEMHTAAMVGDFQPVGTRYLTQSTAFHRAMQAVVASDMYCASSFWLPSARTDPATWNIEVAGDRATIIATYSDWLVDDEQWLIQLEKSSTHWLVTCDDYAPLSRGGTSLCEVLHE